MSHTKEPWSAHFDNTAAGTPFGIIVGGKGKNGLKDVVICHGPDFRNEPISFKAFKEWSARRIVACVNACAAIPIEDLEKAAADPIAGMFGRLAGKSVSQRDHAVRALSQLLSVLDDPHRTAGKTHDALEAARSAVATITGVQP